MRLEYAPEAINDILEIKKYISKTLKNPSAAKRISDMIRSGCKQLKSSPGLGMSVEAKTGYATDWRYLICEKWFAFYVINCDTVRIVRVLDGRTDYMRVLFGSSVTPADEDEADRQMFAKAYAEYQKNPVTYTFDEVIEMLGLD